MTMKSSKRDLSLASRSQTETKKRAKTQANTLLNYFESNKKLVATAEVKQSSILECVKKETKETSAEEIKSDLESKSVKEEADKSAFSILMQKKAEKEQAIEVKTEVPEAKKHPERKCPFYKRIEGTRIVVDAFSYGDIENCDAYFLSHYHYDHFIGLNKHFKNKLFCSKITANLVLKQIKVDKKYIVPLELDKFVNVYDGEDSVQVTCIDANHCPGSVMFLFRFKKTGKYVLHTGDFRASDELVQRFALRNLTIDTIHLDTTYCDSYYKFVPQKKIISIGVELVRKELGKQSNTLIVCGSYTIGKERIFMAIAEELALKVSVTREKWNIINCLENDKLIKMVTLNPNETNLHVISMGLLNIKDLQNYLSKYPNYDNLLAIKPTGWTHKESSLSDGLSIEKKYKNITIYGLEYSEHSSFDELKNFIKTVRPRKIIPHVNVAKKESRDKMQSYFNQWLYN
ncbi:DNA cross-link repair 1A, partial [Brachionus plicatilis]